MKKQTSGKKTPPVWLVLMIICVVAAGCLAVTNGITKDTIEANGKAADVATRQKLISSAVSFDLNEENNVYTGKDNSGSAVGYITTVKEQGFGGEIEVTVAVDPDGTIRGISVGGNNFSETAGLGAKSKEPAFQEQFSGKKAPVALTKNGGEIDAITSATITSSAVIRAVNTAIDALSAEAGFEIQKEEAAIASLGNSRYATSVQGFGGPVYVELQLDNSGVITDMAVGDSSFNETDGLGARAKDESFRSQFIGKTGELKLGEDVDALSGATITSKAVTNAVNDILLFVNDPDGYAAAHAPKQESFERDELGTQVSASAQGMCGPVAVSMTVSDDGKIANITIGDDNFCETESLGSKALEPEFYNQFIGMQLPVSMDNVDAIAGATITTQAVVTAINDAYAALGGAVEAAPETAIAPEAEAAPETEAAPAADVPGTQVSASAQGMCGPVAVSMTVSDDGKIANITIGDENFCETESLGSKALEPEFCNQFIGMQLPVSMDNVDAIAGATITTQAVVTAINDAYATLGGAVETAPAADVPGTLVSASAQGMCGPVAVFMTVSDDGKIAGITIGDENFCETESLGSKALEPEFCNQFIGMQLPVSMDNVDVIAGATITTQAVVTAINDAYAKLGGAVEAAPETAIAPEAETAPETEAAPAADVPGTQVSASAQGMCGPVAVTMTVSDDGKIANITIGDENFCETESLGSKALEPEFCSQFIGMQLPVSMDNVDAIAGATITTQAVVTAINDAYATLGGTVETAPAADVPGTQVSASAQGMCGPVAVVMTVSDDGKIAGITIGDENFCETESLGSKALEPEFCSQFIGMQLPVSMDNVDAIAGATITTQAVVTAINDAYATLGGTVETAPAADVPGTLVSASAQGMCGPIAVSMTVSDDGKIAGITIGDENFCETESLGSKALEPEFCNQFIGMQLPVSMDNVDVIAGATITTQAVINAINACYEQVQPLLAK